MKIGILSMQRIQNMGSLLQAYALKKTLESLKNEVEFLDIKKIDEDNSLLQSYKEDYSVEQEKSGYLGKLKRINKYFFIRLRNHNKAKLQNKVFESFRGEYLEVDKKSDNYDVAIIGSDEVFNCLNSGWWGYSSQLFGNIPEANKVITYAACCGATRFEKLPIKIVESIKNAFLNITSFSVRDENTFSFVRKMGVQDATINLDPVLIYDFEKELLKTKGLQTQNKYCVVYSYANRIYNRDDIREILSFCKINNMVPVALGAPQFWIKDYIVCSPFECLRIIKEASFVITDTFHGTIFATKYCNHFAVLLRDSNKNKLSDLLHRLEIEDHKIESFSELSMVMARSKNVIRLKKILENERINTLEYLKRNLQ